MNSNQKIRLVNIIATIPALTISMIPLSSLGISLESELYGKINISYVHVDSNAHDWISNASRIGIKGDYDLTEDLEFVYQLEQEVDVAHGGKDQNTLFGMRNSFIGLKGSFGKVYWGAFDSPFKRSQGKIDVFNDQIGDIKTLFSGEIRSTDSFMYDSPEFLSGFTVQTMYVPSDNNFDSGKSVALLYNQNEFTAAVSIDADMRKNNQGVNSTKVYDAVRGAVQYSLGNLKIGALYQQSEQQNKIGAKKENGYVLSASYKHDDLTFLAQYGESDILGPDRKNTQLGVDFNLTKKSKVYLYWFDFETATGSEDMISLGTEIKF